VFRAGWPARNLIEVEEVEPIGGITRAGREERGVPEKAVS